jgi:hypothetical protein
MKKIAFITGITSLVLIFEWFSIASGIMPLNKLEPVRINISAYQTWFMSFSIPDQWIVFWCLLSLFSAIRDKSSAIPFSMIAGSSMIFLALCTITFYVQNSMLFDLSSYQLFEDLSCLWLLMTGGWLIYFGILKFEIKR